MATVQSTYPENISALMLGQIADTASCDIRTYIVEDSDIGFAVAVQQGTADNQAKLGIAAGKFVGVTVKDPTLRPDAKDEYEEGGHMAVLFRGTVAVKVEEAVVVGGIVTAKTTTGALSSKAATNTQIKIDGARWMSKAAAGGLAILQLSGELPSA